MIEEDRFDVGFLKDDEQRSSGKSGVIDSLFAEMKINSDSRETHLDRSEGRSSVDIYNVLSLVNGSAPIRAT